MPTLNWIGKNAVINHHHEVPFHLLKEEPSLSVGDPESGNLLVEGDNLLALKALLPYYAGQVKCIYIDPPYNTGNENWVYNDNVNSSEIRKWLGEIVGDEAEDLSRHDKWLCMMYPRLTLLKKFLRSDGVIFVSIDDNEVTSLRLIMDEIFGKNNFIAQFVWNTEGHTDNQFHVKVNHEYVVMYAADEKLMSLGYVVDPNTRKDSNLWAGFAENSITKNGPANPPSEIELPIGFPMSVEKIDLPKSKFPKEILVAMRERGLSSNQLKNEYGKIQFPLRFDSMKGENGKLKNKCRVYSGWANANKLQKFISGKCQPILEADGSKLTFYLSENGVVYYRKDRGDNARNIVSVLRNIGTTEKMRSELQTMDIKFKYPKPKELLKYLLKIGSNEDQIVLDSFAGSGTTGQAVLELLSEEKRKFILIEIEPQIAREITLKRLENVIVGYEKNSVAVRGTGGGIQFCTLGATCFDERGRINPEVKFIDLARHVYFAETGVAVSKRLKADSPLVGVNNDLAVYLLYNGILKDKAPDSGNVLTRGILESLPKHDGPKVIYGTACRLSREFLKSRNVIFKQIPYEIRVK
jgi:adenine specific DNA methylase Mod